MSLTTEPTLRIVVLGNSGSGKSTLARQLAEPGRTPVLDLDTIVWARGKIAVQRAPEAAQAGLVRFCTEHPAWILDGCYAGLAERALAWRPELILLDPGEEACLRHCRARPWEPHKYASKEAQDEKLPFLLSWVSEYYRRDGDMSLLRHREVFDAYRGPKRVVP